MVTCYMATAPGVEATTPPAQRAPGYSEAVSVQGSTNTRKRLSGEPAGKLSADSSGTQASSWIAALSAAIGGAAIVLPRGPNRAREAPARSSAVDSDEVDVVAVDVVHPWVSACPLRQHEASMGLALLAWSPRRDRLEGLAHAPT